MANKFTPEMGSAIVDALDQSAPNGVTPVVLLDLVGNGSKEARTDLALPCNPDFWIIILAQWKPEVAGPEGREHCVQWVRSLWKLLIQLSSDSENDSKDSASESLHDTVMGGQHSGVLGVFGNNVVRLKVVKAEYDPTNAFQKTFN